MKSEFVQSRK